MSMNNKVRSLEDFQSLDLGQLDKIAGGRHLTKTEMDDCSEVARKSWEKKKELLAQGRISEAGELEDNFYRMYMQWFDEVSAAPAGSDDILFSKVFEPYL